MTANLSDPDRTRLALVLVGVPEFIRSDVYFVVAEILDTAAQTAQAEALREAGQLVRDHLIGKVDATEVANFLDYRAARLDLS